jgi:hypothetical protein
MKHEITPKTQYMKSKIHEFISITKNEMSKTTKFLLVAATMFAVMTLNATRVSEPSGLSAAAEYNKVKQCGVSNEQITSYLQNCSHHHSVAWVRDITGTCNSLAAIENCNQATVFVSDGIIVGHQDTNVNCPG